METFVQRSRQLESSLTNSDSQLHEHRAKAKEFEVDNAALSLQLFEKEAELARLTEALSKERANSSAMQRELSELRPAVEKSAATTPVLQRELSDWRSAAEKCAGEIEELETQLAQLRKQNDELRSVVQADSASYTQATASLKDEIVQARRLVASTQEHVTTLEKDLRAAHQRADTMETQYRESLGDLQETTDSLHEQQALAAILKTELDRETSRRERAESALAEARRRVESLESDLVSTSSRLSTLESMLNDSEDASARKEHDLDRALTDVTDAQAASTRLQLELESEIIAHRKADAALDEARRRMSAVEGELVETQQRLVAQEQQLRMSQGRIDDLNSKLGSAASDHTEAQAASTRLQVELASEISAHRKVDAALGEARRRVNELESQLVGTQQRLVAQEQQLRASQAIIDDLTAKVGHVTEEHSTSRSLLDATHKERDEWRSAAEEFANRIEEQEKRLMECKQVIQVYESQISDVQLRAGLIGENLETERGRANAIRAQLEAERHERERDVSSARDRIQQLAHELNSAKSKLEQVLNANNKVVFL